MAEQPNLIRGRIGRLDAESLNRTAKVTREARNDLETSPTPFAREGRHAFGAFPIIAYLKDKVTQEGATLGYRWEEVVYVSGSWTALDELRKYDEEENNYVVPFGNTLETVDYSDTYARIDYAYGPDGIVLYFEPAGGAASTTQVAMITGGGQTCEVTPGQLYDIEMMRLVSNSEGSVAFENAGVSGKAINLLEMTGSFLGGQISSTDCAVEINPTSIPVGTYVLVSNIGSFIQDTTGDGEPVIQPMFGFLLSNDLCITCCENLAREAGTGTSAAARRVRGVPTRNRHPLAVEMKR